LAKNNFTEEQKKKIQEAIATAELNTSGEIRVHIDDRCKMDPMKNAIEVFERLGMHQTEQRNGVLFYVALQDHKLAILGDKGINDVVPEHFWDVIRDLMIDQFKQEKFTEGLIQGILMAGQELKVAFPYNEADNNELSNDISFQEDAE